MLKINVEELQISDDFLENDWEFIIFLYYTYYVELLLNRAVQFPTKSNLVEFLIY